MNRALTCVILLLVILSLSSQVQAFGAGNIPSFAYLEGKAFRHGDIEDALSGLVKGSAGGGFALGHLFGKSKFGGLDIKRVYFGNWLRDYSQAVDVASLKKLPLQTIINLCMVLGFMAHGYATNEFEVTRERLAVYLPTEHIDNPKGYGDGDDARKYDSRLRGPVDPRELEIDPRTGMKNYIANESGTWDTSKALVRRTLERCIGLGRQHRSTGQKADLYESYRLLGQALHTLEDFSAHSNFCELALISQGHVHVFSHVGDYNKVQTPTGRSVFPLVTGTFGSSDFIHSLLGEATDHLSEASVSDLNKEISSARSKEATSSASSTLRELLFSLPGNTGSEISRDMEGIESIRSGSTQGGKLPDDLSPQELHAVLWQVLSFRDSVVKKISKTIEKIPGLGPLIEKLMESIQVFIFTTLEPYLKPLLKTASSGLSSAAAEVTDNHHQYEVFDDPMASDPTHSFLSKDHFNLILNEPAGHLAKIIVTHTVNLVTEAWGNTSVNVNQVTGEALQCLFHPDFHDPNSKIQREMLQYMQSWAQSHGHRQYEIIARLNKDAVRTHRNIRLAGEGGVPAAESTAAHSYGIQAQHQIQGYLNSVPGVTQAQSVFNTFQNFGGNTTRRDINAAGVPPSTEAYRPPQGPPLPSTYPMPGGLRYDNPGYGGSYAPHLYNSPQSLQALPGSRPPFPGSGFSPPPTFSSPVIGTGPYQAPPGPPPNFSGHSPWPPGDSYSRQSPPAQFPSGNSPSSGYNPSYAYNNGPPPGNW